MSDDKMREEFEKSMDIKTGVIFKGNEYVSPYRADADHVYTLNRDWQIFQNAWQAALTQQPESEPDDYTVDDLADIVCVRIATMLGVEVDYLDGDGTPYSLTLDAVDHVDRAIRDSGLQYDRDENVFICPQPTPQVPEPSREVFEEELRGWLGGDAEYKDKRLERRGGNYKDDAVEMSWFVYRKTNRIGPFAPSIAVKEKTDER